MNKIIIRVSGGMVQAVYADKDFEVDISVLDEDVLMNCGDEDRLAEIETHHAELEREIENMEIAY